MSGAGRQGELGGSRRRACCRDEAVEVSHFWVVDQRVCDHDCGVESVVVDDKRGKISEWQRSKPKYSRVDRSVRQRIVTIS